MKKLMIALVAAMMAVVANAATINWNSSKLNMVDEDGKYTTQSMYAGKTAIQSFVVNAYLYSAVEGQKGVLLATSTVTTPPANALSAATGSFSYNAALSTDYYVAIDMTVNFGNGDVQTFLNTDAVKITTQSTGNTTANFGTLGVVHTTGTEWSAVPEPTSGLLLIIGMAGLALRRRRA